MRRVILVFSYFAMQLCSEMTGTWLHCVDVIVLMVFQGAITSPLSSVTSTLFLFFYLYTYPRAVYRTLCHCALLSVSLRLLLSIALAPYHFFLF